MRKKKVIVSVTNDLMGDQRVHKVCLFLGKNNLDVTLVGRKLDNAPPIDKRAYSTKRMRLLFNTGPLFYAEYNLRLFFFLLFRKTDVLVSNDLDTLLPNYLISKLKSIPLFYDSHEYFTGVPELQGRTFTKGIWTRIERFCLPKVKHVYTVSQSVADKYADEYHMHMNVVRNFPVYEKEQVELNSQFTIHNSQLPIILYQGSVNKDRGLEEAIEAMQFVNGAVLLIVGDGDVKADLNSLVKKLKLENKVMFHDRVPFNQLQQLTRQATIGISLEKETNLNYSYSLPNKVFDYAHGGVPVLASPLAEIKKVFAQHEIGSLIENHQPKHIAEKLNFMLSSAEQLAAWKQNCLVAAKELNWENEEKVLQEVYSCVFG